MDGSFKRIDCNPMDITTSKQLVPYDKGLRPLVRYERRQPDIMPANSNPASRRHTQAPSPASTGYQVQSWGKVSIYIPSQNLKAQKIDQVGLLIDIYA